MTDHFLSQVSKPFEEETTKQQTTNSNQATGVHKSKKHKLSTKVAPEKQISLYSLAEPIKNSSLDKEREYRKNKVIQSQNSYSSSNNNTSNLINYNNASNYNSNSKKSNFQSPTQKNFKSKYSNSGVSNNKDKDNKEKDHYSNNNSNTNTNNKQSKVNELLSSPSVNNTTKNKIQIMNSNYSRLNQVNNKSSNNNLPISVVPKACITSSQFMSPSSTTHKSYDSSHSQTSVYNLKRSEKSDDENLPTNNSIGLKGALSNNINNGLSNNAVISGTNSNINANSYLNNLVNTANTVNTNNSNTNSKKSNDFKLKYKTEKCKFWELYKECKYGDNVSKTLITLLSSLLLLLQCAFAHGLEEIKLKTNINPNYKTKKCIQFYENGYCPYGIRCQFLHKEQFVGDKPATIAPITTTSTIPNNYFYSPQTIIGGVSQVSKELSYKKLLDSIMDKYNQTNVNNNYASNQNQIKNHIQTNFSIANTNSNSIPPNKAEVNIDINNINCNSNINSNLINNDANNSSSIDPESRKRLNAFKMIVNNNNNNANINNEEIDNLGINNGHNYLNDYNPYLDNSNKRNRANTDHEEYNQRALKQISKFHNFTNLMTKDKNTSTNNETYIEKENMILASSTNNPVSLQKLYLMNRMSTTTEVDVELEQRCSHILDKEKEQYYNEYQSKNQDKDEDEDIDFSAEYQEIENEIKNYTKMSKEASYNKEYLNNNNYYNDKEETTDYKNLDSYNFCNIENLKMNDSLNDSDINKNNDNDGDEAQLKKKFSRSRFLSAQTSFYILFYSNGDSNANILQWWLIKIHISKNKKISRIFY